MNELNYASFESSKKLFDAGIILETEFYWVEREDWSSLNLDGSSKNIITIDEKDDCDEFAIPAPSFGEAWRELPEDIFIEEEYYKLSIWKSDEKLVCCYSNQNDNFRTLPKCSENITDALIELLLKFREKPIEIEGEQYVHT